MDLHGTLVCKCKFCGHRVDHDYSKLPIVGGHKFKEKEIKADPCIPVNPTVKKERMKHVYEPLPAFFLHKPVQPTYPPTEPLQRETTYTYEFYPKFTEKVTFERPNYYHYRPTAPFVGQSVMKSAFQPFFIFEDVKPPGTSSFDSDYDYCGDHLREIDVDPTRPECKTTFRFSYYPKKVLRRKDPRNWWQKPAPYATPLVRVETLTTSRAAYTAPPIGTQSFRASKPKGNL